MNLKDLDSNSLDINLSNSTTNTTNSPINNSIDNALTKYQLLNDELSNEISNEITNELNNENDEINETINNLPNDQVIAYPAVNLYGYHPFYHSINYLSVYQFPNIYTNLLNSADVLGLHSLIDKLIHKNCVFRFHMANNKTVDQNSSYFLKQLVVVTVKSFPDAIVTLDSVKFTRRGRVTMIKTKGTFGGTITSHHYKEVLYPEEDGVNERPNKLIQSVLNYSSTFFIDDFTNRIIGYDAKFKFLSL